jgi:iron(III) transport system permease protein
MTRWRLAVGLLLLVFLGVPLAFPLVRLLTNPAAWRVWGEADRLASLARNTASLTLTVVAVAVPLGVAAAVLLYRTDLPFRRAFRFLTLLALFVPLPLFASGWQTVLGSSGWLPLSWWNPPRPGAASATAPGGVWAPWGQGVGSAVWIHAAAALPWVILIVGQGLRWVERDLEEDALTAAGRWRVLTDVTLRRSAAAIGAAALWVGLQTATEITITDMMQVRTYAEEVYTQFVAPEPDDAGLAQDDMIARAVAAAAPQLVGFALLVAFTAGRWERNLPPLVGATAEPLLSPLGWCRWPLCAVVGVACAALLAVPLGSLVWRAGLEGTPPAWSAVATWRHLSLTARKDGGALAGSLLQATASGAISAGLALLACWAALGSRWFRNAVLVLMALAWAMPGPVVGLGLKETIDALLRATHDLRPLRIALWDGPSPLPLLWVDVIRFFPYAVAVLWPVVRLTPPELRDAARVDGAPPLREFLSVILPMYMAAALRAALAAAVLSLGEISAGKLVMTPGWDSFAQNVWTQMHYGVGNDLAASCLLMLAAVTLGATLTALPGRLRRPPG